MILGLQDLEFRESGLCSSQRRHEIDASQGLGVEGVLSETHPDLPPDFKACQSERFHPSRM